MPLDVAGWLAGSLGWIGWIGRQIKLFKQATAFLLDRGPPMRFMSHRHFCSRRLLSLLCLLTHYQFSSFRRLLFDLEIHRDERSRLSFILFLYLRVASCVVDCDALVPNGNSIIIIQQTQFAVVKNDFFHLFGRSDDGGRYVWFWELMKTQFEEFYWCSKKLSLNIKL